MLDRLIEDLGNPRVEALFHDIVINKSCDSNDDRLIEVIVHKFVDLPLVVCDNDEIILETCHLTL